MATAQSSAPSISALRSCRSPSSSKFSPVSVVRLPESHHRSNSGRGSARRRLSIKAMVQQDLQGGPATYAKEMERLSAKESLLLAFKDSGGFEALITGKTTDMQRIDVNERIIALERLNPTPRPTTSPSLEGRWNFEWFGSTTPGSSAVKFIFERFPSSLANLSKMDVAIKDGYTKVTAIMKLLNSIESKVTVTAKLTVEGPLRMKEEYVEGVFEPPTLIEGSLPEQLKDALSQATSTVQQLPAHIKDAVNSGLKIPLNGTYQRLFMISYLDDEILIIRDATGLAEVLTRLDVPSSQTAAAATEYES